MKNILLISFCLLFLPQLSAQKYLLDSIQPNLGTLIREEYNRLYYADSSAGFNAFINKLDSLYHGEEDRIHIIHIGGSHIQADLYPNKLREYLRNLCPGYESPRGLVFPYRLAGTNNPLNYSITGNREKWKRFRSPVKSDSASWGITGITVRLEAFSDTLLIRANNKNQTLKPYYFNKIRILTDSDTAIYNLEIADSRVRIVSDSLMAAFAIREYTLSDTLQTATLIIRYNDSTYQGKFNLMGIELVNPNPGVQYTSIGVNGASFESWARCGLFEQQLKFYKPDLFIVSIGTNDAYTTTFDSEKFRDAYKAMLEMVKNTNPHCALMLTVPNDSYYRRKAPNKNTRIQQEIIHSLAKEYHAVVWDFYAVMGGFGSSQRWYLRKLMPRDRVHFTTTGYSLKADLLLKALVTRWEESCGYEAESMLKIITGKR